MEDSWGEWQAILERAVRSKKTVDWTTGVHPTIGHVARIDGKWIFVQIFKGGERAGEVATVFHPSQGQLRVILEKIRRR